MKSLKALHLYYGIIGIFLFLLSGQYMGIVHSQLAGMADGPRMLYRSAHIYLLLLSVIHLMIGVYLQPNQNQLNRIVQGIISLLLFLAPILVMIGFFTEAKLAGLTRPYTLYSMYAIFTVVVIVLLNLLITKFNRWRQSKSNLQ